MQETLNEIGNNTADWILAVGGLFGLIFTLHYGFKAPWWRVAVLDDEGNVQYDAQGNKITEPNRIGRMFMMFGVALCLFSAIVLLSLFLGPTYPGRVLVRLFGYSFYTLAVFGFTLTYFRERRSAVPRLPTRKHPLSGDSSTIDIDADD